MQLREIVIKEIEKILKINKIDNNETSKNYEEISSCDCKRIYFRVEKK